ncbi:MAG: arsenate reductase [Rhodobacteraceae bacterium HLUCCA08]|nr:MAG: arsenate reductase [Rhodobacteraceae bacterium HLUCCA08]
MRFFGLKTCDTCRKALKELRAAGHDPQVIDIRADGIGADDRATILAAFGAAALNTRSTTWRALSEAERARDPADLLVDHPTLMKRPVIEAEGTWHQGWTPAVKAVLLG